MNISLLDVKSAYIKLKSYIYHDNTDLLLRQKLVEFEANLDKDIIAHNVSRYYKSSETIFAPLKYFTLEEKLDQITEGINSFNEDPSFFNKILDDIRIDFYPKKLKARIEEINYISNQRINKKYEIERVTPFINAPIELHIISVLWIMKQGVKLDKALDPNCLGNRLLLNKEQTSIVEGSGLFKPYFNQYQKWRDGAVQAASSIINKGKDVAFLNLDVKDYFSSVRIKKSEIYSPPKRNIHHELLNLEHIFWLIHKEYSVQLSKSPGAPRDFYSELLNKKGKVENVVLPIGLTSSYVLANNYLKKFDARIHNYISPAYYGRYVDDLIFVLSDPTPGFKEIEKNKKLKFNFERYKELKPSKLEKFVLEIFHPFIDLVDINEKTTANSEFQEITKAFKLLEYESLHCQSEKSLLHLFKANESHLVIEKLKQELDDRTSEFRDFPNDEENNLSFATSAYHLHYDGSEGKIRTLKDYKENKFGLTVFLSNKIFSALRQKNKISDNECKQLIDFFKGETCIKFYRLWEKILTLLLVNKKPKYYVEFVLHCIHQIEKIRIEGDNTYQNIINKTLVNYLDVANEMVQCLNLSFFDNSKNIIRNFEFKLNSIESGITAFSLGDFRITRPGSYWLKRFRKSNMMRHHYTVHPLLTFCKSSKKGTLMDLTSINLNFKNYRLDEELLNSSPRRVKFCECCISLIFEEIGNVEDVDQIGKICQTNLFGSISSKNSHLQNDVEPNDEEGDEHKDLFYLDQAYERFKQVNNNHIPHYDLESEDFKNNIYSIKTRIKQNSPIVNTYEISANDKKQEFGKFKIAFANTKVTEKNIIDGMRGTPNLSSDRYDKIANILRKVRLDNCDILLFPEFFIPINLLSSIVKNSAKNNVLTVTGLEHVRVGNTAFNFIVSIMPIEIQGIRDAVIVIRLKNHYAPIEEYLIRGNHLNVVKPLMSRYDILIWKNLYLSPYYCFELANVWHRSLFKSKLDLLVGVEWNKDTNYFSKIIESSSRDLHCYIAQVNTSQYGDSRLTQPVESARKDILRLKGGSNDAILIANIELDKMREFQRKTFDITHHDREFKPLPPDYNVDNVLKRINNKSVI